MQIVFSRMFSVGIWHSHIHVILVEERTMTMERKWNGKLSLKISSQNLSWWAPPGWMHVEIKSLDADETCRLVLAVGLLWPAWLYFSLWESIISLPPNYGVGPVIVLAKRMGLGNRRATTWNLQGWTSHCVYEKSHMKHRYNELTKLLTFQDIANLLLDLNSAMFEGSL